MSNIYRYIDGVYTNTPLCTHCKHTFLPEPRRPRATYFAHGLQVGKSDAQLAAEDAEYSREVRAWQTEVKQHIVSQHEYAECRFCGDIVRATGLRRHHKSVQCVVAQRNKNLIDRGYVNVDKDFKLIVEAHNKLKEDLILGLEWDAAVTRKEFSRVANTCLELLMDLCKIDCFDSKYDNGWEAEAWATPETATALNESLRKYKKLINDPALLEALYFMWDWAHLPEDEKLAAVGVWELANERN